MLAMLNIHLPIIYKTKIINIQGAPENFLAGGKNLEYGGFFDRKEKIVGAEGTFFDF